MPKSNNLVNAKNIIIYTAGMNRNLDTLSKSILSRHENITNYVKIPEQKLTLENGLQQEGMTLQELREEGNTLKDIAEFIKERINISTDI